MKLNFAEQILVNNSVRASVQRFYEGPLLRRLGGVVKDGTALEIGCGRGAGIEIILQQFEVAHVCGIDLDPLQIERARKTFRAGAMGGSLSCKAMRSDCPSRIEAAVQYSISARCTMCRTGREVLQKSGEF